LKIAVPIQPQLNFNFGSLKVEEGGAAFGGGIHLPLLRPGLLLRSGRCFTGCLENASSVF